MILIHTGKDTAEAVREFAVALTGSEDVHHVRGDWEDEIVSILKDSHDSVAFVFAHGEPSAAELRAVSHEFTSDVIHVSLSTSDPSLAVADEYVQKVASFSWPIRSGAALGALAAKLRGALVGSASDDSHLLLGAVREYFQDAFVREELLAAYLIRLLHPTDDSFRNRMQELGLDGRYGSMSRTELEVELKRDFKDIAT